MRFRHWSLTLLVLAMGAGTAFAQGRASIRGQVVSAASLLPIEGATIVLRRTPPGDSAVRDSIRVSSNREGRFRFERLTAGRYVLEASHLADTLPPTSLDLARTEVIEVELTVGRPDSAVAILPELRVEAPVRPRSISTRDEFERRRSLGLGQFITREMILQRNPPAFMDLFRMATGMEVRCRRGECLPRVIRARPGCYPAVMIDGTPTDVRVLLGVRPGDVEGMEIYLGLAEGGGHCGLIVVWTRLGMDERDRKQLKKPAAP